MLRIILLVMLPQVASLFFRRIVAERVEFVVPHHNLCGTSANHSFNNLGHFARDYRRKFGELPSETLRRHQS